MEWLRLEAGRSSGDPPSSLHRAIEGRIQLYSEGHPCRGNGVRVVPQKEGPHDGSGGVGRLGEGLGGDA